jgi:hypothetical protein
MREIKRRNLGGAACVALLIGGVGGVRADDGFDGITTSFSGYGTLGGTFTTGDSRVAYRHDGSEFEGASGQFDLGLESRLGLQAVVDFGSGFSVTAQELFRERGDERFSPGTEWLYLQYTPDSDWKFRVGRVALGTFLLSDSRNVGYAAPWFRAPNELYGAEPYQNLDGAQVYWSHSIGPAVLGLQGSFGNTYENSEFDGYTLRTTVKNAYNLSASLQYQSLLVRVAQTTLNEPIVLPITIPGFNPNFELKDKFLSVGTQYDNGTAIVLAEWARRSENLVPMFNEQLTASVQWYVAGGWRFGKLTPLVTYGAVNAQTSLAQPVEQTFGTWSASLRYDVVRDIALKAEWSRPQASNGTYWVNPDPTSSVRVNVFSLGADFVF